MLELEDVKSHLKIDYTDEDKDLNRLIQGSYYLLDGIIKDMDTKMLNEKFKVKAELVMLAIISDCHESKKLVEEKKEELKFTMGTIIRQLQYCTYI